VDVKVGEEVRSLLQEAQQVEGAKVGVELIQALFGPVEVRQGEHVLFELLEPRVGQRAVDCPVVKEGVRAGGQRTREGGNGDGVMMRYPEKLGSPQQATHPQLQEEWCKPTTSVNCIVGEGVVVSVEAFSRAFRGAATEEYPEVLVHVALEGRDVGHGERAARACKGLHATQRRPHDTSLVDDHPESKRDGTVRPQRDKRCPGGLHGQEAEFNLNVDHVGSPATAAQIAGGVGDVGSMCA